MTTAVVQHELVFSPCDPSGDKANKSLVDCIQADSDKSDYSTCVRFSLDCLDFLHLSSVVPAVSRSTDPSLTVLRWKIGFGSGAT